MARFGGQLPNRVIINKNEKLFLLLRVNGNSEFELPDGWEFSERDLHDLAVRSAYRQITSKEQAEQLLPESVTRYYV